MNDKDACKHPYKVAFGSVTAVAETFEVLLYSLMGASPEKLVELFSSMIYHVSKGFVETNVEKESHLEKKYASIFARMRYSQLQSSK